MKTLFANATFMAVTGLTSAFKTPDCYMHNCAFARVMPMKQSRPLALKPAPSEMSARDVTVRHLSNMERNNESQMSIREQIQSLSDRIRAVQPTPQENLCTKMVYIIGSGVSPTLTSLSLNILSILSTADVILIDSLSLPESELRLIVPTNCTILNVGKRGDRPSMKQLEIDQLLLTQAKSSRNDIVVRLKGGDPFLFGRSRTEIETLQSNNISYSVIPNLSSAIAGPHFGGIPLTDPLLGANSFAVFSGTTAAGTCVAGSTLEAPLKPRNWDDVHVDTLVFLMIGRLDKLHLLCQALTSNNQRWNTDTPCGVIQNAGSEANQKVWRSTLSEIVKVIQSDLKNDENTVSPAVFVVGRVASLNLLENTA